MFNIYLHCFVLFCLEPIIPTYKQQFVLQYTGTVITTITKAAYKAEIEDQISSVQSDLQTQCKNSMEINAPVVVLSPTVTFVIVGSKVCIIVVA